MAGSNWGRHKIHIRCRRLGMKTGKQSISLKYRSHMERIRSWVCQVKWNTLLTFISHVSFYIFNAAKRNVLIASVARTIVGWDSTGLELAGLPGGVLVSAPFGPWNVLLAGTEGYLVLTWGELILVGPGFPQLTPSLLSLSTFSQLDSFAFTCKTNTFETVISGTAAQKETERSPP